MNSPVCLHDVDWDVVTFLLHTLVKTVLVLDVDVSRIQCSTNFDKTFI